MFGKKLLGANNEKDVQDIFCSMCQKKIGLTGYNPKNEWAIEGKLCSVCYGKLLGAYRNMPTNIKSENAHKTNSNHLMESVSNSLDEKHVNDNVTKCQKCSHINVEGSKFCSLCGSSLQPKCSKCENIPPQGSKFCNQCGSPL